MKTIELGPELLALEPDNNRDDIDTVPDRLFAKNKVSLEARRVYEHYKAKIRVVGEEPADGI